MKKFADAIIQPSIIAVGCGIFLYAYNQNLRNVDYFLHLPFWIGIVRPTGIWWHTVSSFLIETEISEINQ